MSLLPLAAAPILSAVVIILFGIFVEKHYVGFWTAVMNVVAVFIALTTLNVAWEVIAVLVGYSAFMLFLTWLGNDDLLWFAGSRVTGGLLLGMALADSGHFANPLDYTSVLMLSGGIAVACYIAGWINTALSK